METPTATEFAATEEASREFVGRWNHLVSTTNWEKGRIIAEWRHALAAAGASPLAFADEAWSRQVGNVSGQHVGRLRRVYERFGGVQPDYAGLYWSHFQAALDWEDAEMWLEGAVQNRWSVSQMRLNRWEVLGKPADQQPREEDVVTAELDEDAATEVEAGAVQSASQTVRDVASGPDYGQGPDFGDDGPAGEVGVAEPFDADPANYVTGDPATLVRPFAELPQLPDDLQEAFDQFKLAILHHKLARWSDVSRDDVLASLDALKQLATAPSSERTEAAPF